MGEVVLRSNGWRRSSLLPPVPSLFNLSAIHYSMPLCLHFFSGNRPHSWEKRIQRTQRYSIDCTEP